VKVRILLMCAFVLFLVLGAWYYYVAHNPSGREVENLSRPDSSKQSASPTEDAKPKLTKAPQNSSVEFEKIVRFRRKGFKGSRFYTVVKDNESSSLEESTLGFGFRNPAEHLLGQLNSVFRCELHSQYGEAFSYFSASRVCDGYGARGVEAGFYLARTLVDASFEPLYLCHTVDVVLYNTLNPKCDGRGDHVNAVLGYVRRSSSETH